MGLGNTSNDYKTKAPSKVQLLLVNMRKDVEENMAIALDSLGNNELLIQLNCTVLILRQKGVANNVQPVPGFWQPHHLLWFLLNSFVFYSPFSPAQYRMLLAVVAVFSFLHVQSWVGRDLWRSNLLWERESRWGVAPVTESRSPRTADD